jgi:hypothetical protein
MPSDPVKAVRWFFHWLLKVLVRFFWLPILGMGAFETYQNWRIDGAFNGIAAGVITVLVGTGVWALLYGLLTLVNVATGISQVISQVQQGMSSQNPFYRYDTFDNYRNSEREDQVVEGTITDLEEERRKRKFE